jgi:hypothetical protein
LDEGKTRAIIIGSADGSTSKARGAVVLQRQREEKSQIFD